MSAPVDRAQGANGRIIPFAQGRALLRPARFVGSCRDRWFHRTRLVLVLATLANL
jgi:hypothetical protein